MPTRPLQQALDELRAELEHVADEDSREKLTAMIGQIEHMIDNPTDTDHHQGLLERTRASIDHLEAAHPKATGVLNQILVALSSMGL